MANTLLSIKTDEKTKRELKAFAAELGVSSTALVNLVVRQALRDRRVLLSTNLEPTPYLEDIIQQVNEDYSNGRDITDTKSTDEVSSHLTNLMDS